MAKELDFIGKKSKAVKTVTVTKRKYTKRKTATTSTKKTAWTGNVSVSIPRNSYEAFQLGMILGQVATQ